MTSPAPDSFLGQPSPSPAAGAGTGTGVAASSPSKPKLTLDDITRLFNIPITEAASILGVSTSVLKRLCRKNGIARWPYRQLLSGKTIDDIKKEAEIERRKLQKDREEMGKRKAESSKANSATTVGSFKTIGDQNRMATGQALQGSRIIGPQVDPFSPMKNIPTYLDEFKFGFPSAGLSSTSNKWWGSEESDPEQSSAKETDPEKSCVKESGPKQSSIKESDPEQSSVKEPEPKQSSVKESDLEQSTVKETEVTKNPVKETETPKNPFERLVALRRRAVEESRALLEGKGNKVIESCSLKKKQKTALLQVFGSSLPDEWQSVVS